MSLQYSNCTKRFYKNLNPRALPNASWICYISIYPVINKACSNTLSKGLALSKS